MDSSFFSIPNRFAALVPACFVYIARYRVVWVRSADIECWNTGSQHDMDFSVPVIQGFWLGHVRFDIVGTTTSNTFPNEAFD
jgi:hypothetical protein